ncbi:MAG: hypothetical protein IPG76_16770 [Acidobacteria bacterium]|nr:hypothetical protein [Acidobacteriota bacterium]
MTIPKAGRETVNVSVAGGPSSVPVKKMSAEGGDYLAWSNDGAMLTWSWGSKFHRQTANADKSESFDISVEMPRAKPKGNVILSGARIITMKGDEVIERGDITITDNRITDIKATPAKGKPVYPAGARVSRRARISAGARSRG